VDWVFLYFIGNYHQMGKAIPNLGKGTSKPRRILCNATTIFSEFTKKNTNV